MPIQHFFADGQFVAQNCLYFPGIRAAFFIAFAVVIVGITLHRPQSAKFFASMDMKTGYWQIEIDGRDRENTAFITRDGLYEFKVTPFGLRRAPATFQRVTDAVLADLKWQTCLVYINDVVVFS